MAIGTQADTNRVVLRGAAESTYKTPPGGTYEEFPFVGESLTQDNASAASETVESSRRTSDVFRQAILARGDVRSEMRYGQHDWILPGTIFSAAWTSPLTVGPATTISFEDITTGGGTAKLKDSASGFTSIVAYDILLISGATNSENNSLVKVTNKVGNDELDVLVLNAGADFVTEAAGASVTVVRGASIVDGTTCTSYTLEREYTDRSNTFAQFVGMVPATVTFEQPADNKGTIAIGFLGAQETEPAPTSSDASGTTAAPATRIIRGQGTDQHVFVNGAPTEWTRWRIGHDNQVRNRVAGGQESAISVGAGTALTTGQLELYMGDQPAEQGYARAFTEVPIVVVTRDETPAGSPTGPNRYVHDLPACFFGRAERPAGAQNQDVIQVLPFQAKENTDEGFQYRIWRFPGA